MKIYIGGKKLSKNIPSVFLDIVSLHSKDSVTTWKVVSHRRLVPEREPFIDS